MAPLPRRATSTNRSTKQHKIHTPRAWKQSTSPPSDWRHLRIGATAVPLCHRFPWQAPPRHSQGPQAMSAQIHADLPHSANAGTPRHPVLTLFSRNMSPGDSKSSLVPLPAVKAVSVFHAHIDQCMNASNGCPSASPPTHTSIIMVPHKPSSHPESCGTLPIAHSVLPGCAACAQSELAALGCGASLCQCVGQGRSMSLSSTHNTTGRGGAPVGCANPRTYTPLQLLFQFQQLFLSHSPGDSSILHLPERGICGVPILKRVCISTTSSPSLNGDSPT